MKTFLHYIIITLLVPTFWMPIFLNAQERTILKPNGITVLHKGNPSNLEVIPISNLEKQKMHKNKSIIRKHSNSDNPLTLMDTLFIGGESTTNFGFNGQDRMVQWFEAPTNLYLKKVGFAFCSALEPIATLEVKIVAFQPYITRDSLEYLNDAWVGSYEALGNNYHDVTAFWDDRDRTGPWTGIDGHPEVFGNDIWSDIGFGKSFTPIWDSVNINYQFVDLSDLGYPYIEAGTIFGIALKNNAPLLNASRVGIRGTTTGDNNQFSLWKFYADGRLVPGVDFGWWSRDVQLFFAAVVEPVLTPAAPTNLTANTISTSRIDLNWQDNSNNEDGFRIEKKLGSGGTYTEIATVNANVTSYSNTGLTANTDYCYQVRAYNTSGNSAYSNEACATTTQNAPTAPSNLTASAVSTTQINVNWQDSSTNEDGFRIERKLGSGGTYTEIATVNANVTSYSNTSLTANTDYCYRVRAYNTSGNSAYSNEACATTTQNAPTAPSILTASAVSTTQINVNWQDNSNNEDGFRIERKLGSGGTYTEIATVNANVTSYSNTGLTANTDYCYQVRAYNTSGNSAYSNEECKFTPVDYPSHIDITTSYSFDDYKQTSSYHMIGIPGANNLPISNFIPGTPGKEGDWRAFWDKGSGSYTEYSSGSSTFYFKPGRAFWVLSKKTIDIDLVDVPTVTLAGDTTYSISVHKGWNLISNPFDKSISWNNVLDANPGENQPIHFYQTGSYTNPTNFEQYIGYYFKINDTTLTSLKIPYVSSNPLPKNNSVNPSEFEIMLTSNSVQKAMISIGVSENAESGIDINDIFSPPSQFCEISMSLLNDNLETNYKYLQKEYRLAIGEGQEYNIVIKNTSDQTLELVTKGFEHFNEYEIYILDKSLMKIYNLREQNKIEVKQNTPGKEYSLFIGTEEYILQKKSGLVPTEYLLYQNYPNPFNPNTIIMFALPHQSKISLAVYNILGELVAVLINDQLYEEGYHEIMFDGSLLSSGVYIYRIQAGEFSDIKKMLLLK